MQNDDLFNLFARIEENFSEMEDDALVALQEKNATYRELCIKRMEVLEGCPALKSLLSLGKAAALSREDTHVLLEYLDIKDQCADMEHMELYFRGHTDCIHYLMKMNILPRKPSEDRT